MDAVHTLEGEVRELIRRSGLDPARDEGEVRRLVREAVADYDERSLLGGMPVLTDVDAASRAVWDTVAGYGPLQQYFDDPSVEEIWVNEPSRVFVARNGVAELTTTLLSHDQVRDLVERMLKSSGRRVDLSSPFVDAVLPDGSRLHVVIPDITRDHWYVNVRKFVVKADSMDDLVRLGTLTRQAARFLEAAVASGLNVLVAGGTQAGKTTLLNCLASAVPARERIVTCEEVFELRIPHRDVASMQCRQPSLEGTGEIPLRRLVKEALRMRPVADRRRRGAPGGEPRPAHRPELRAAGHVHHPRQQRSRGRHEDVHPPAAGRRERVGPLRRPDGGGLDRPRRARGPGARRPPHGPRDRRSAGAGRG